MAQAPLLATLACLECRGHKWPSWPMLCFAKARAETRLSKTIPLPRLGNWNWKEGQGIAIFIFILVGGGCAYGARPQRLLSLSLFLDEFDVFFYTAHIYTIYYICDISHTLFPSPSLFCSLSLSLSLPLYIYALSLPLSQSLAVNMCDPQQSTCCFSRFTSLGGAHLCTKCLGNGAKNACSV